MRFKICLSYNGGAFYGWAKQEGLLTVEGAVKHALNIIFQTDISLVAAGRTDKGVHALEQICHAEIKDKYIYNLHKQALGFYAKNQAFKSKLHCCTRRALDKKHINNICPNKRTILDAHAQQYSLSKKDIYLLEKYLLYKLKKLLAKYENINIKSIQYISDDFDARFSAVSREYVYVVLNKENNPIINDLCYFLRQPLSLRKLKKCAKLFKGYYNFAAFCKTDISYKGEGAAKTANRRIYLFKWKKKKNIFLAYIKADAFCYHLVRNAVGACIAYSYNKLSLNDIQAMLNTAIRHKQFKMAAAKGLYLRKINYPPKRHYAKRAKKTRNIRL